MPVLLLLWLLSAALTASSPMPAGTADLTARPPAHSASVYPAVSSPSGATHPSGSVVRDEKVHEAGAAGELHTQDGVLGTPAEESAGSSVLSEEEEDDVLPDDEDIDGQSLFAALVGDDDDDDDQSHREARFFSLGGRESPTSEARASEPRALAQDTQRAVSDPSTIAKYNHFIDVFFRRVNFELKANGEPLEISLSKKGLKKQKREKEVNKKKGMNKKGNKNEKRNPRGFSQVGFNGTDDHVLEEATPESSEADGIQGFKHIANYTSEDDSEELEDSAEVSSSSSRQSKDLKLEDEDEADHDLAEDLDGRGLGMEKRRAESKKIDKNKGNKAKNAKQRKNKKRQQAFRTNKNKKGNNNKKKKKEKGGKKKSGGKKRRKKNKVNRGRSRDSDEERGLGMDGRKRKDENQHIRTSGEDQENGKKGKKNKKNKKGKKGKKRKADTKASVSGISSLVRDGDVNVTQSSDSQKISSHFTLGLVRIHLSRRFSDGQVKTAELTASLRGTAVIEVNRSGRAKITKLKLRKPYNVTTEGSLREDDGDKKKGNKADKVVKTSIKKVSPQIGKQIESIARSVLEATSSAVRS